MALSWHNICSFYSVKLTLTHFALQLDSSVKNKLKTAKKHHREIEILMSRQSFYPKNVPRNTDLFLQHLLGALDYDRQT